MPITITGVTLAATPATQPCPQTPAGTFTVTVTVTGYVTGIGGSYDVELRDKDQQADDLLDSALANTITGGAQTFSKAHIFTLNCDDGCEVIGPLGSSGEQQAELVAVVKVGTTEKRSNQKNLTCGAGTYRPRRVSVK